MAGLRLRKNTGFGISKLKVVEARKKKGGEKKQQLEIVFL